ncbi:ABC transporter ATP-binding protein [Salinibacterium sp. ZJ450]|uniref:ABC transporter ATP-binding protein n=1 Tax=Salinibacterium sp. ZJ450 TaxID=2708338 RepID=UPI001420251A|nr:ABC transporter ATP-binding protein [Salinibacterium sp. ZJ450]
MADAVRTEALVKRFGRTTALRGLDLAVPVGSIFGVIGPNGAGKTTTMRVVLDIVRPTSGRVEVLGTSPRQGGPALRRRIGYLPGELKLESRVRGGDLLAHFARISGGVPERRITELADRLRVDLSRPVRTLSKGNKQKLGLVQAFMHRPELLVLDEPTSGLDPLVQQEVHALLREAAADGQTVFLSSHVLSEVQNTATDVAILREGRVITVNTVEELRRTAIRRVRIEIADAAAPALHALLVTVPGVTDLVEPTPTSATLSLSGDPDPLVKTLAHFHVTELTIEEPDLEQAVLGLYGTPADA